MDAAIALLSDYTVRTVLAGAVVLGVVSGALGSFAVLRKQSLLGDTLSHAALPGVALGFLVVGGRTLAGILVGALTTGVAAALLVVLLVRRSRLKTDAALGIALSVFFAVGVVLLSWVQGRSGAGQAGLESFLFGQAAAIRRGDVVLMAVVTAIALALLMLGWKELKATTFDPVFAASIGLPVRVLDAAMTAMIAVAVVLGLQMVGVVLMSAMVVAPAVAARQWTRRLEAMVVLAALFGAAGGVAGGLISATGPGLSTGPLIVLALTAIVVVSLAAAPERGLVRDALRHRRASRALRANQLLAALHRLAQQHGDPAYATEQGTLDALFGTRTRGPLRRLETRGLVEEVRHRPEENAHWALTDDGREEALHLSKHGPSSAAEARS